MAVVNPPLALQNAGNVHTAEILRNAFNVLTAGTLGSNSLKTRGGVQHQQGFGLAVSQNGSPNMSVNVASGNAMIAGSEDSNQGCYHVQNDATLNVSIAAADPSLPRIDLIVFKVQDSFYSGVTNTSSIVAVTGTPNASPSAPAAPANSITLARVAVGAAVTSIVNANITDTRFFLVATGGIIICSSTSRPAFSDVTQTGQFIFETDTQLVRSWDGASSSWIQRTPYVVTQKLGGTTASVTFSNIPTSMKKVRLTYTARGTAGVTNSVMIMRLNSDSTSGHYVHNNVQTINTSTFVGVNTGGTDRFTVGIISAASVTATNYGVGWVEFMGWEGPHNWVSCTFMNHVYSDSAPNSGVFWGGGQYIQNAPYTSITVLPDTGSFATNSEFRLEAWE